jgi:transposase InsO family protein
MKLWLTPQEFAELSAEGALPALPASKRGMNELIRREGWDGRPSLRRERRGREGGGGLEYHIDNLPLAMRLAYAARFVRIEAADLRPAITDGDGLTAKGRAARDARLILIRLADRFRHDGALSVVAADTLFSDLFNAGSIDVPAFVTAEIGRLSARTLARWRSIRDRDGTDALGHDPATARKGTGALDRACGGKVRTAVLAAIARKPFISAKDVEAFVIDNFGAEFTVPPLRTIQQTLKAWKVQYRNDLLLLTDPDRYRSAVEFSAVNATRAERLNQLWQIDASPADVMLKAGRHSIYLAVDIFSRRTKVLVTPTPRAAGVGLLMRKCLLAWGVPEIVNTDNGSDFIAYSTKRLLSALRIEVKLSAPFEPRSKGNVERAIGTFQRSLAGLPGFIGHSVADRKVIENRKAFSKRIGADPAELFEVDMDLAEFQAWCDDWSDKIYATTPHEGLGGRTPFEMAASYAGKVRHIENAAALDVLLAPAPGKDGLRTVTKTGIRINGSHYLTGAAMPGATVFCRMAPADFGRILLFEPDGESFIGEAHCPELAGLDPVETIARVKAAQKAFMDERVRPIRAEMKKIGPRAIADAVRRQGEKRAAKLIAFPQRRETHSTPALEAAETALRKNDAAPLGDQAARLHAQMQCETPPSVLPEIPPARGEIRRLPETREQRFRRALDIERRMEAGETVAERDLLWLGGYRAGTEYQALREVFDEFGEAMSL